jgi:probable F420-dependent oxidoreductase
MAATARETKKPFQFSVGPGGICNDMPAWAGWCRRLEDLGFYSVNVGDHPALPRIGPVAGMAAACAATTRLRVGALVFGNDYRHPLMLAREIATLDQIYGGRIEFGIGAGWFTEDYVQFGIPHDAIGRRIERMAEAVAIVKRYFTGEPFSHQGTHYRITNVTGWPKPLQAPRPPLVLGGGGPRMLGFAAREADMVDFNFAFKSGNLTQWAGATCTRAATSAKLALVREQAGERFASLDLSITMHALELTSEVRAAAEKSARFYSLTPEEVMDSPHFLIGDEGAVTDKLLAMREEFGFSRINLSGNMIDNAAKLIRRLAGA